MDRAYTTPVFTETLSRSTRAQVPFCMKPSISFVFEDAKPMRSQRKSHGRQSSVINILGTLRESGEQERVT